MSVDQNHHGRPRGSPASGSDQGASPKVFQLNTKLRVKMDKLAEWRLDSAAIEFLQEAREFRGGFATVSRALLVTKSSNGSNEGQSEHAGGENGSDGTVSSQKTVAVKKMKIENEKDLEKVLGLALREAGFLAELSHENIIKLEGFVEDVSQARIWLVFPWAENGNLKEFVTSADWEIPERIWLIHDVARGVEYLHNRDPPICHGDLKSVNILVNSEYRAMITDFGSARRLAEKDTEARTKQVKIDSEPQPTLVLEATVCASTNTITLTGNKYTLRWAAPELLNEEEPCLGSDIWALGWIFYEVMTNKIPFEEIKNEFAIINTVIQGHLPSVTEHVRMSLILQLCSLMIECWSIDPSNRPTAEGCQKSIIWMPMIKPNPHRNSNSTVSRAQYAKLLMQLGHMHRYQNDYVSASKLYNEALGICTDTSDLLGKAYALWGLATVNRLENNYSEAVKLYSQALEIQTDIGDRGGRAENLSGLAHVYRLQNNYSEAAKLYSQDLEIRTDIGDKQGRADALWSLATVHRLQKNCSEAVKLYSQALEIRTDIGDRRGRADTLSGLADVHRLQNNYSEAAKLYSQALATRTEIGDRQGRAYALWGLAEVHRVQKEYTKATTLFSEALQISTDIGDRYWGGMALQGLANTHRDQDHHTEAISFYKQAAEVFQEIEDTKDADIALSCAADVRQRLESVPGQLTFRRTFRDRMSSFLHRLLT